MQQLLAADFYGWQSGARRAAATAGEADRTLLGGKSDGPGRKNESSLSSTAARGIEYSRKGEDGADAAASGHEEGGERCRGRSNANVGNNRNPVLGGFQRLRNVNVRGADGEGASRRTSAAAAVAAAAGEAAALPPSSAAARLQTSTDASRSAPGQGSPDWAAASSASSGEESGDDFNFEVSLDVEEGGEGEGGDERRPQGWRRGWMGGGNQDVESGSGSGGGGGGGPINWWG